MFGNVRLVLGTILENLRKSSEGGRKSSENHQKRRHQHVYIIKRTLHGGLKIWILFSRGKNNILLPALVYKILFCHSKIKFISSCHRVISSIYVAHLRPPWLLWCKCRDIFMGQLVTRHRKNKATVLPVPTKSLLICLLFEYWFIMVCLHWSWKALIGSGQLTYKSFFDVYMCYSSGAVKIQKAWFSYN